MKLYKLLFLTLFVPFSLSSLAQDESSSDVEEIVVVGTQIKGEHSTVVLVGCMMVVG